MLDHPRSLTGARKPAFKFRLDRFGSFEDINCQSKVLQIWLKTPIRVAKIYVIGGFDPKHYFSSSRPQTALPWRETRPMSHRAL